MKNKVPEAFVDTDVIIRFLSTDDQKKQEAATLMFDKVEKGELLLRAPDTTIADAVYVLSSEKLYNLPRSYIRDILATLLRLSFFKVENKQALLDALDLYTIHNVDFSDAFAVAFIRRSKTKVIYSYDRDFDKFDEITRKEP